MTSLLLDTHVVLWFFWDDPLLSGTAKALIEDADNRKLVSVASCWEIAIKSSLGKLRLGASRLCCGIVSPQVGYLIVMNCRRHVALLPIDW
jgi:PIN domain nuclease of toxin-antitoxin system